MARAAMLASVTLATPTLVACPSPAMRFGLEDALELRLAPGESVHVTIELNEWATAQGRTLWVQARSTSAPRPVLEVVADDPVADEVSTTSEAGGYVLSEGDLSRLCAPAVPCRVGLTITVPMTVASLVDVRVLSGANRPVEGCGYRAASPEFDPRAELLIVED